MVTWQVADVELECSMVYTEYQNLSAEYEVKKTTKALLFISPKLQSYTTSMDRTQCKVHKGLFDRSKFRHLHKSVIALND